MIIIIVQSPQYMLQNHDWQEIKAFNFDSPVLLLQNLGIFIFSYNITTTYHVVKSGLENPSMSRLLKMGLYTVATLYLPYACIGILGYMSLGEKAKMTDLFPNRVPLLDSYDILMKIGKVGLVITIYVAYLMRFIVIKTQVFSFFKMEMTTKKNVIFTLCFMFLPVVIGWSYPQVTDWFSIIGAFSMTALIITIPSTMMAKEYYLEKEFKKLTLILCWGIPNTVLGLMATVSVFLKMIGYL